MAVKISHLDRLLSLTGEIIITAGNMSILQRHLQSQATRLDKDSTDMVKSAVLTANRISSDLHHLVMDIRLLPIRDTFLRFRRLVRDLAKKKGRQINFDIVGEDTLVDKTVAERLYEPLAHQIRNAVDHGLEDPLDRKQQGKNPQGQLTLTAYKKEGFTYVSVADDGRGLDIEGIRRAAVEKGLISPEAAAGLSPSECYALIMRPGFSTAREATEISGRGVGMDVVKSTIEEMAGEILIESQVGQGSTFTYKIPQLSAVNITDALIVRAGESFYAIPINNVVATQAFEPEELHTTMEAGVSIIYLGSIIPLWDLGELLSGRRAEEERGALPVIIIEAKNGRIALGVSEFIRPQKLVLIPLPEIFTVQGVAGTTILGGNQLGLVLEPFELIALAQGVSGDAAEDAFLSRATVAMDDEPVPPPAKPVETPAAKAAPAGEKEPPPPSPVLEMEGRLAEEFFLEIRDILKDLNEEVFQLEKEPDNAQRVNTLFRYFHSIKGNLIMTGFVSLGNFVHQVETVLDRIRDRDLEVDQEIIDLLLDAARMIEEALGEIRAGRGYEVKDQDLLATLKNYQRDETEAEAALPEEEDEIFRLSPLGRLLQHARISQGANIYQTLLQFKPRFQEPFLAAYLIIRRLAQLGDVIDTIPSLERIEKGQVKDKIKVLFSTKFGQQEVDRFMERQLVKHFGVTEFENLLME